MADFDRELAITRYTELSRWIDAGAYDERDHEGNYGEDGIEREIDNLSYQAAQHGLAFHWHKESRTYTLEPLDDENKAAFLHVNVEALVSILAETAQYLVSLPYQSDLERSARTGLHKRIEEVLRDSYRVPVLCEESGAEPEDLVAEMHRRIDQDILMHPGEQDETFEEKDEEDEESGDGSGLHQCPYCYNLVDEEHEEFCRLNPNRNREVVP